MVVLMESICDGLGGDGSEGEGQGKYRHVDVDKNPVLINEYSYYSANLSPVQPPLTLMMSLHPSGALRELCASLAADLLEWSHRHAPVQRSSSQGGWGETHLYMTKYVRHIYLFLTSLKGI